MSTYKSQFVSMICCGSLDGNEYLSDMAMAIKSRVRKAASSGFTIKLQARNGHNETCILETDEKDGFKVFEQFEYPQCAEVPVEMTCSAGCDPVTLKEEIHKAIIDISDLNSMTAFFYKEDAAD